MSDSDFDLFYSGYPRKRARPDAEKAWKQVEKDRPPIEELNEAVQLLWVNEWRHRPGKRYIPYPGRFLRTHGWEAADEFRKPKLEEKISDPASSLRYLAQSWVEKEMPEKTEEARERFATEDPHSLLVAFKALTGKAFFGTVVAD